MPIFQGSRYTFSVGAKDYAGRTMLTVPEPFTYRDLADNIPHEALSGDTWQSIAGQHYAGFLARPESYYWCITDFQPGGPMVDVTVPPRPGTIVVVPSARVVKEEILAEKRRDEVPG